MIVGTVVNIGCFLFSNLDHRRELDAVFQDKAQLFKWRVLTQLWDSNTSSTECVLFELPCHLFSIGKIVCGAQRIVCCSIVVGHWNQTGSVDDSATSYPGLLICPWPRPLCWEQMGQTDEATETGGQSREAYGHVSNMSHNNRHRQRKEGGHSGNKQQQMDDMRSDYCNSEGSWPPWTFLLK